MRPAWVVGLLCAVGCGSVHDSPTDGGAGSDASAAGTLVAPYFYSYGWNNPAYAFTTLVDMTAKGGPRAVSIGFVLSNGGCEATADIHHHVDDVKAYVAAGGHVRASFGGATGSYLEYACSSASDLAGAIERFIDATGLTDLDFDLEQHAQSSNPTLNAMRAQALKQVQDARHAKISFTFPVAPSGMLSESVEILSAVISAGVDVSIVNGLAMDYGSGTNLTTTPMSSVEGMAQQVHALLPKLSTAEVYHHLGVTPMIGKNDDGEVLSTTDAQGLVSYVRQHALGLVSFWAIQRDQVCKGQQELGVCSQHNTRTFEYDAIFETAR